MQKIIAIRLFIFGVAYFIMSFSSLAVNYIPNEGDYMSTIQPLQFRIMCFIYNAVEDGWSVAKCPIDNTYVFSRNFCSSSSSSPNSADHSIIHHEEEVLSEGHLHSFLKSNSLLQINSMNNATANTSAFTNTT